MEPIPFYMSLQFFEDIPWVLDDEETESPIANKTVF
jgi:hypothetical protein